MKIFFVSVFFALIVFICAWFLLNSVLSTYAALPSGANPGQKTIHIKPGQTFNTTARQLYESGFIKNRFKFKLLARIKGYDKKIKTGEYVFSETMSPGQILEMLCSGKVRLHRFTIPEGYNLNQIAERVEVAGFSSKQEFLNHAKHISGDGALCYQARTYEGYLFPDTYFFSSDITAKQIISTMFNRFKSVFSDKWEKRAKELGFTVHQIVTIASIIEKETGDALEYSIISSVFHNRLKKGMRLESDPTVIYGIKNFNGNITRKDLTTLTPYNTYKIRGLPPGPIANPGAKALKAALYPGDTNFLYFVSKNNGTHKFSTNFKDHNEAVLKYQLRKR